MGGLHHEHIHTPTHIFFFPHKGLHLHKHTPTQFVSFFPHKGYNIYTYTHPHTFSFSPRGVQHLLIHTPIHNFFSLQKGPKYFFPHHWWGFLNKICPTRPHGKMENTCSHQLQPWGEGQTVKIRPNQVVRSPVDLYNTSSAQSIPHLEGSGQFHRKVRVWWYILPYRHAASQPNPCHGKLNVEAHWSVLSMWIGRPEGDPKVWKYRIPRAGALGISRSLHQKSGSLTL